MCNKDQLVSYLYGDLDGGQRALFERHLRGCDECRVELEAMRSVRTDLLTWSPPEPDFSFRVVREPRESNVIRPALPAWRAWFTPAAGFAAAAVLVLAAASAIARVEIQKGPDGFVVRTGWSAFAPASASDAVFGQRFGATGARDVYLSAPGREADTFAAIERRIAALEASSRDGGFRSASALSARASSEEIVKVVRDLLAQSETRQKGEIAVRMQQLMRDLDLKHTADLAPMRQRLARIDVSVAEEAAARSDLTTYLLANSKQK